MIIPSLSRLPADGQHTDVCIVGAGPAGIVLALELADLGLHVLMLESGVQRYDRRVQALADAHVDPARHAPLHEATRRQFGGTSAIWGGRCVPMDPIDFEQRDFVPHSGWPIPYAEVAAHYPAACRYAGCGRADFDAHTAFQHAPPGIVPGLPDADVSSSSLERWASPTEFARAYRRRIARDESITLALDATCIAINCSQDPHAVSSLTVQSLSGTRTEVKARVYVIAAGGLESTRLLLNSDRVHPGGIGNHGGQLGSFYMGHPSGKIADVQFLTRPEETVFQFERDPARVYCRRRFTIAPQMQREKGLLNCALWLDNPRLADASHRNGILSFAYLALSAPGLNRFLAPEAIVKAAIEAPLASEISEHVKNVLRDTLAVASFVPSFAYRRYIARRRVPGFFLRSSSNRYALHYHAEQAPNASSRVRLSAETDELGMRRLLVDLRFSALDASSVVATHRLLDSHLRRHHCGRLIWKYDDLEAAVLSQARDGFHQAGTTRMSSAPEGGVVDPHCRVHGVNNLYVCSSSVFPTSGQANPTLTVLALALRLAHHLAPALMRDPS
ncbi:MAG TPA: GMC family oxidoreductase [Burkholderiales bacterium]|nr:GMC family oxidoreductase [Burkholderiales bacterium]